MWGSIASMLGLLLAVLQIIIGWPVNSNGNSLDPPIQKKNLKKVQEIIIDSNAPNFQNIRLLIPIFRNLSQMTEKIPLPAVEACDQASASQENRTVDRFSSDARNLLSVALSNRANILVIKRERLADAICEMELGRSGMVDRETASKLGKQLGANIQVEGSIDNVRVKKHKFKGYGVESVRTNVTARLSISFVSVETGTSLFSTILEGEEESVSTSFGDMDDSDMVSAAIRNAIDNFKDIEVLKTKLRL